MWKMWQETKSKVGSGGMTEINKILSDCKLSKTGCIEWQRGRIGSNFYSGIYYNKRTWAGHRLIWTLTFGPIPEKQYVMHKCDNPICINIHHLSIGTPKDNMVDKMKKNRHHCQHKTHCPHGHEYAGENLRFDKHGHRICRACVRRRGDERKKK
jgi:hypothetical protein